MCGRSHLRVAGLRFLAAVAAAGLLGGIPGATPGGAVPASSGTVSVEAAPEAWRLVPDAVTTRDAGSLASLPPDAIEPLRSSPSWIAEGDQEQAAFGSAVQTAGDVNGDGYSDVIVGSPGFDHGENDEGRAALYLGSATGLSANPAWTFEGDQTGAGLGASVATAGDVNGDGYADVIVGAPGFSHDREHEGRAIVFLGSPRGLNPGPAWMVDGDQAGAGLGGSVAMAGDVNADGYADVLVGASRYDGGEADEGRARVYYGSPGGLSPNAAWTAEGNQAGAGFGCSVAAAGDVDGDGCADIIVGAAGYDHARTDEGRVFLYRGSRSGLPADASWVAGCDQAGARFGCSVGTAGDVDGDGYADVIVGADRYDPRSPDAGRAFVFRGPFLGPESRAAWTSDGRQAGAGFGCSVGTAGDVNGDGYADVIVGAASYDNGQTDEGRALVYLGSANGLSNQAARTEESDQASARFGAGVGPAGDVNGDGLSDVIVGAAGYDHGQSDEGRAYVYHGVAGVLAATPSWTAIDDQAYATFGQSVATAGDVNGDGYSDVLVGAPMYDHGQQTEGRAYLYLGSPGGLAPDPFWIAEGNQPGAYLGVSVATAGDVNGDGYSDVIVGAYRASHGQSEEGLAYLYLGSSSGLSLVPAWMGESNQAGAWYGFRVATAGDVNGDGFSDVIVGAAIYDTNQIDAGRTYVYAGSPAGLSATPIWVVDCQQAYAKFGVVVGTAGDVNGDGYSDIIVGAYQQDNGSSDEGRAYVYLGSSSGVSTTPVWTAEGNQISAWFGYPVGTAGDVNGDGYSDVIVGAQWCDQGQLDEGMVFVYYGSPGGPSTNPSWTADSNQILAGFGVSAATAGDVNNDGYADVVIGAQHYDNPEPSEGRAFLYLGSANGLTADPIWTTESDQVEAFLGYSTGTAGDVNGDGYADVVVGASYYDAGGRTDVGRADVFYGNAGGGLPRVPGQLRTDGSAPIWPLCASDSESGFLLRASGRTPQGRGAVCLQYEVKPFGTPFDGSSLVTGPAQDTGFPGRGGGSVTLLEPVTGLTPDALYHWRLRTTTESPFFPRSPWYSLPYNSVAEADVRTRRIAWQLLKRASPATEALMVRGSPAPPRAITSLVYNLTERGKVRLGIYDAVGREVLVLVDEEEASGSHMVQWDGTDSRGVGLPAGVYFARLRRDGRETASKVVRTR